MIRGKTQIWGFLISHCTIFSHVPEPKPLCSSVSQGSPHLSSCYIAKTAVQSFISFSHKDVAFLRLSVTQRQDVAFPQSLKFSPNQEQWYCRQEGTFNQWRQSSSNCQPDRKNLKGHQTSFHGSSSSKALASLDISRTTWSWPLNICAARCKHDH